MGIANSRDALNRLDEDEKSSVVLNDGIPGNPSTAIVSESGMYALVLSSRKSEAKPFRKWVTSEVLPSIRKTGEYAIPSGIASLHAPQQPQQNQLPNTTAIAGTH